jgi:3-phenylpropionate/trans-cinnamate dioxygenase ferredoxin reductase component
MNAVSARIIIVGAGHAGGSAAALLRQYGWKGSITLIGAEPRPPYQRPPLSKAWLKGESDLASVLLRPASFYVANDIALRLSSEVMEIDRSGRRLALGTGEYIPYDHLVLALGARARMLPLPGRDLAGVLELRTLDDADRLKALLRPGLRLAVIGAGYIGLEVAASARTHHGADVVVVERESRVLARVASHPLSQFMQCRHEADGVRILLGANVEAFEGVRGHVTGVRLSDGRQIPCDAVLVGVGAAPNDALPRAAGLDCADGVLVDLATRTSDPAIRAIGDCTNRPLPVYHRMGRLESVPNALEQAKQSSAALCDRPPPAAEVPWFWSDQYEVRLQIAGLPFDAVEIVVRGDPATGAFAIFHLTADGTVQAVEAVNSPAEFMAGRTMIATRRQATASRLRDVSRSMRDVAR